MAVVGVLVQAQVGHEHGGVAHLGGQVPERELDDAGRVVGRRAAAVLDGGNAEQDQPADARVHRLGGGLPQAVPGVLDDAGHGADRLRLGDALLDEHGQHQVGGPYGRSRATSVRNAAVRRSRRGRTAGNPAFT